MALLFVQTKKHLRQKKRKHRRMVIEEILHTEENYVDQLQELCKIKFKLSGNVQVFRQGALILTSLFCVQGTF